MKIIYVTFFILPINPLIWSRREDFDYHVSYQETDQNLCRLGFKYLIFGCLFKIQILYIKLLNNTCSSQYLCADLYTKPEKGFYNSILLSLFKLSNFQKREIEINKIFKRTKIIRIVLFIITNSLSTNILQASDNSMANRMNLII